jgi:hypothetical protein
MPGLTGVVAVDGGGAEAGEAVDLEVEGVAVGQGVVVGSLALGMRKLESNEGPKVRKNESMVGRATSARSDLTA